jgi:hypothetical protein
MVSATEATATVAAVTALATTEAVKVVAIMSHRRYYPLLL